MNTRVSLGLLYVLSLLLLVVSIGCDDESFEARQSAVIEVAPNALRAGRQATELQLANADQVVSSRRFS